MAPPSTYSVWPVMYDASSLARKAAAAAMSFESLDVEGLIYHNAGPSYDEWAGGSAAVCSLFGLQGA